MFEVAGLAHAGYQGSLYRATVTSTCDNFARVKYLDLQDETDVRKPLREIVHISQLSRVPKLVAIVISVRPYSPPSRGGGRLLIPHPSCSASSTPTSAS